MRTMSMTHLHSRHLSQCHSYHLSLFIHRGTGRHLHKMWRNYGNLLGHTDEDHAAAAEHDRDREANARAEVEAMQQFKRESGMLAEYPTSTSAFTTM